MADDNLPPLPKIRDDDYTDLLSKKGEKEYEKYFRRQPALVRDRRRSSDKVFRVR